MSRERGSDFMDLKSMKRVLLRLGNAGVKTEFPKLDLVQKEVRESD